MGIEKKRSTLSVLFYIKRQKLLKNGEAPICMRITADKRKAEIMIKCSIPAALWNQAKECSKGKDRNSAELNHYINAIRAKILQIHRELETEGCMITADAIRDRFYGRDKIQRTLLEVYAEHNEKCRALIGKEYTESTVAKFDTSINRLREFIRFSYHKDDLFLNMLDGRFVHDFEYWLKTSIGCKNNSALKHLKNLKKVIRIAQANEWIKKDPFSGIHFKVEEVKVEFLSKEELDTLMKKDFGIKRLEQVRDVFVFCCFTGMAFADVYQLCKEHLIKDNNGCLWIRKARQKTKRMCNIPVISPARALIEKYASNPECMAKDVLFPVLSNQKMNAYLKEIADICGIHKRLTTHVARHTAATVVFLANEVSMENVAKILGHSNIRMTQHYAKILDSSIMRDMGNVERRFSKM
ncbi:MAG: site-specific integrase [Paraprevotella sp.]|nr:site-specific integrase [Paraprevotella sp.]